MTYQSNFGYRYWTAFAEADLLGAGDWNLNRGDSFTMPGAATLTLAAYDNDGTLSGDYNDRATDSHQNGWVHDGNGWTNTHSRFFVEQVFTLQGSDGKTYHLAEIEGGGYNAPGAGDDFFSFVGNTPPAGVTLKVITSSNSHGVKYSDLSATPSQPPANVAPVFDNLPGNGILHIDENSTAVIDIDATDADGDTLTYSITGGRDAAFFEIDAHTGELSFKEAPDFENPQSGGDSNVYDVTITVDDGNGGTTTKPLWVKVNDVEETDGGMECIIIEAEDMALYNMTVQHGAQASGGELVRLAHLGGTGDLSTTFNGDGGTYDLSIFAQDESDGQSTIMVKVNGQVVEAVKLDQDDDGVGSNNGGFSEFVIEGVELTTGDEIMIWVDGDAGEFVRLDKIKLQEVEPEPGFRECDDPNAVNLDFEGLAKGTVLSTQFDGVMISAQRDGDASSSANDAMVFDSSNPTGGDADLATDDQGNILIISEDNDSSDPDDNAGGGTIWFKFDEPAYIYDIKVVDSEEGGTIRLLDANGALIETITIPNGTDGGIQQVLIDVDGVAQIDLTLNGSGAIDDLCYVPGEPAPLGALEGRYFCDENGDNVDNGEPGVAGATVELLDAAGNVVGTTTTDADGNYRFDDLDAGDYSVRFQSPDDVAGSEGKVFVDADAGGDDTVDSDVINGDGSTGTVTVVAGETTSDVDAGIVDPAGSVIRGTVFCDEDDTSTQNNGEAGVAGVTVTLSNGQTAVTDANGNYEFTGLPAGDYTVTFPTEFEGKTLVDSNVGGDDTIDSDAVDNGDGTATTGTISLGINDVSDENDAGIEVVDTGDASIAGRVFCDDNNNDVDDGEPGVGGVTVTLSNGMTTVTDANGNYEFTGLPAGDYTVTFPSVVDGKTLVDSNVGGDDTIDSDAVDNGDGTATTGTISLEIGERSEDNDAGIEDPGTASVGNLVFLDENGNGVFDDGEGLVAGATVELLNADGTVVATQVTGDDGEYCFEGLDAGVYSVQFTAPDGSGLVFTSEGAAADDAVNNDSDADSSGATDQFELSIGEEEKDIDAGLVDPAGSVIRGTVFCDEDDTSTQNNGEAGVAGVTVTLSNGQTAVTDANGNYEFTGLPAGDYTVTFPTEFEGKTLVDSNVGGDDTIDSDAVDNGDGTATTGTISLGVNDVSENNDAGIEDPGTAAITGRYFCDENDNDVDDGEPGIAGATVTLLDANGNPTGLTTTTDTNGNYSFTGLLAGTYAVAFAAEASGKSFVALDDPDGNGDDTNDSDVDPFTGTTAPITVAIGETSENNDAGVEDPGTAALGDTVFIDANGNGQQDAGEVGVEGVQVELIDVNGGPSQFTTTDENGMYLFDNLDAGDYQVNFEEVDGFDFTTANQGDDASDSDADQTTGTTGTVSLDIGEIDLTVDAGLVAENGAPNPADDAVTGCADEDITLNVLGNDSDPDGESLTVTAINGVAISEGETITVDGVEITLNGGELVFNGEAQFADLDIGDEATVDYTYTVSDGTDTSDATASVTFKGDANSVESLIDSLPAEIDAVFGGFFPDEGFSTFIDGSGDERLDGQIFENAYCLERPEDFVDNVFVSGSVTVGLDSAVEQSDFENDNVGSLLEVQDEDGNTLSITTGVAGNLDLINWLVNQDFTSQDNGDGTGTTYNDAEVQLAIWGITDGDSSPQDGAIATQDNVDELIALAIANGEGFEAGEDDLASFIFDPNETQDGVAEADDHDQAFIVFVPFEEFDCIC